MNDEEFLQYLEANLGQRWKKHDRGRLWTLVPRYTSIRATLFTTAEKQQKLINQTRADIAEKVARRLAV